MKYVWTILKVMHEMYMSYNRRLLTGVLHPLCKKLENEYLNRCQSYLYPRFLCVFLFKLEVTFIARERFALMVSLLMFPKVETASGFVDT